MNRPDALLESSFSSLGFAQGIFKVKSVRTIGAQSLLDFCQACFEKLGVPSAAAHLTASNLIFANLRGVDSHGVIRLKIYLERLRAGGFKADGQIRLVEEGVSTAVLDAGQALGQVAAQRAMELAIEKAAISGAAFVTVRNSNHFGAAAFYALRALSEGMIGLAATNAGASMAPTGGREGRLGNNPIAIAVPALRHPPIILDLATGAAAWGKIFVAQQENKKIPATWALDKFGLPTEDPNAAADKGLIQPFGGYKGYGLSLLIDVLTGVLSGGSFSTHIHTLYQNLADPSGVAHACAALRIDRFIPVDDFRARIDELIDLMHSCPKAPGAERIYVPGEVEHEIEQRRRSDGIPINPALQSDLEQIARELSLSPPD